METKQLNHKIRIVLNFQIQGQTLEEDKLLLRYMCIFSATKQNVDISLKPQGREIAHGLTFIQSLLCARHCSTCLTCINSLSYSHHEKGTRSIPFGERRGSFSTMRLSDFQFSKSDTDSKQEQSCRISCDQWKKWKLTVWYPSKLVYTYRAFTI